jgi:putative hydrolase of the HAD superfamily
MPTRAILFDLDDTLVIEEPGARSAFLATCQRVPAHYGFVPQQIHEAVLQAARDIWYNAPCADYVKRIGVSSWEGLWAAFDGDGADLAALRQWKGTYRRQAWTRGLASLGIDDPALADELAAAYITERRKRHELFPETRAVLDRLRGRYALAVVSNGVRDIQYDKLNATGITDYFDAVVISADLGIGKPDPALVIEALNRLDAPPADAVLVGNSLKRDIGAARAAGVRAVWINREDASPDDEAAPDATIRDLTELLPLL